jgi:hypothetical protein
MIRELAFLAEYTGQDEVTLLARALQLGLDVLYREAIEQAFIDGAVTREEAIATLGHERVDEIEYARQALTQDVTRGLNL